MNKRQAEHLLAIITSETRNLSTELYQIGNGEWVVIIEHYLFCWSREDWYDNASRLLGARKFKLVEAW